MSSFSLVAFLAVSGLAWANDPIRLAEKTSPGAQFRIVSNSSISGELLAPVAKDKPAERIKIQGKSTIDYAERILAVDSKDAEHKSLRVYEKIEFRKSAGDRTDEMTLRPAVRRLVVMKKGHAKVPFSPDGPLTWAEIDMLRTDFVVAALAGLLPAKEVRMGDTWQASAAAIAELTDLDKVEKGELVCTLDKVIAAGPRKLAQVTFAGDLRGVNEDGPTRQKLAGRLLVDLAAECITFLKVEGEHFLLDAEGKEAGKITGTFELTRAPVSDHAALSDKALKGVELVPSEENTRLLYDSVETGVRFVHPRHWRVVRTNGRQITLDETDGAGLLITLETADGVPTPARYQREAMKELQERGAKLTNRSDPERLADGVERFTLDAELSQEKVTMDYIVIRQDKGGATLAARLPAAQREARMKELERLARSFVVARALDGK
jgi:hypothetical protein